MTYAARTSFYSDRNLDYAKELSDIRRLTHLLDEAFRVPVIGYRVGLDAILGLVPVVGDFSGFAISAYIIFKAARLGLPRWVVARMVFNALLDAFVGSIPIIGDLFDLFWKVNKRNLRLIERHLRAYA